MAREVVAYFEVRFTGGDQHGLKDHIQIYGNEEFFLGRNAQLCRHYWPDPRISNKHLRVHCLLYEENPISGIPPFVYATDISTNGTVLRKGVDDVSTTSTLWMRRNDGAHLLHEGDELQISPAMTLVFHTLVEAEGFLLTKFQREEQKAFRDRYLITSRALGAGGYGKVFMALHRETNRQLACKIIDLSIVYAKLQALDCESVTNLCSPNASFISRGKHKSSTEGICQRRRRPSKVQKCFREFEILQNLNHPNIVAIEKVFWSSTSIYIFQELITGGDLFSYLEYKGARLCDVEAAVIVQQIIRGLEYLHDRGIVHRDLKPDNILMTSLADGARVVITDFGNARYLPPEADIEQQTVKRRMFSLVGTLEYTAPEVHKRNSTIAADHGYSKSVDMWSVGSITAALLTGDVIFVDRHHPEYEDNPREVILELAAACDLSVLDDHDHPAWSHVGRRPKDFIRKLLVLDERERLTVSQALRHPWFSHKCYAREFEALYERAIKEWQPRRKVFRLIEQINVQKSHISTDMGLHEDISTAAVASQYFPVLHNSDLGIAISGLPTISEKDEISDGDTPAANANVNEISMDHLSLEQHGNRFRASNGTTGVEEPGSFRASMSESVERISESPSPGHDASLITTPEHQVNLASIQKPPTHTKKRRQSDFDGSVDDHSYAHMSQESAATIVPVKIGITKRRKVVKITSEEV